MRLLLLLLLLLAVQTLISSFFSMQVSQENTGFCNNSAAVLEHT